MNPQVVMYILYGVFAFIILIAALTGLRRGLNKSLYWFFVCIIFFALFFGTMNIASQGLYNTFLKDRVPDIIAELNLGIDPDITSSQVFLDHVYMIAQMAIKIVYFFALWIVFYFICWILWLAIFKRLLMGKKVSRKARKAAKNAPAIQEVEKVDTSKMTRKERKAYKIAQKKAAKQAKIDAKIAAKQARIDDKAARKRARYKARHETKYEKNVRYALYEQRALAAKNGAKAEAKKETRIEKEFRLGIEEELERRNKKKGKYKSSSRKESKYEKELRLAREEQQGKKRKKRRLLGGLVGIVRGCMSSFIILCLLNAVVALVPDFNREKVTASTDAQEEIATDFFYEFVKDKVSFIDDVLDYVEVYKDSVLNKVTKIKVNGTTIDLQFTDAFLSGSYKTKDGKTVKLNIFGEMKRLINVADMACELTEGFDLENVKFQALNERQQSLLENIIKSISDDDFIIGSIPAVISFGLVYDELSKTLTEYGIDETTFAKVDWKKDLKAISSIVKDVYALGENNDLTHIDYYNMDKTRVEKILTTFANLTVVQPSLKIAGRSLLANADFKDVIGEISDEFWDKVNAKDEILNIKEIYDHFVDSGVGTIIKEEQENGNDLNFLKILTSLSKEGNASAQLIISNLFESVFVKEVVENVVKHFVDQIEDENIKEMINLDVLHGEDGKADFNLWVNELNTILELAKEVSVEGTIPLEKFDVKVIKNITVDTLLRSKLLTYATKTFLVNAAKGNDTLVKDASKYIDLPETLKDVNAPAWDSELKTTLTAFKKILDKIEDFDDILKSLPDVVEVLDNDEATLLDSDIIYYSINKALPEFLDTNIVAIPSTAPYYENGRISRDVLKEVITACSAIDVSSLLVTTTFTDEDGNQKTETKIKHTVDDAMVVFANLEDEQLKTISKSIILRATVTYNAKVSADDFIVIPSDCVTEKNVQFIDFEKNGSNAGTYDIISEKETVNLLKALKEFKDKDGNMLDFTKLEEKPQEILNYISTDAARKIFTSTSTQYSKIAHASISKFIIDKGAEGTLVIPNAGYEDTAKTLIKSSELVSIVDTVKKANVNFDTIEDDPLGVLDNLEISVVEDIVLKKNTATYSSIVHATLSKYLIDPGEESDKIFIVPESCTETVDGIKYVKDSEVINLVKVVKHETFKDLDLQNLTFKDLTIKGIYEARADLSKDVIIRATITDYLKKDASGIKVPVTALQEAGTTPYISEAEMLNLIESLNGLFIDPTKPETEELTLSSLDNLDISNFTLDKIKATKNSLVKSYIIRNIFTEQAAKELGEGVDKTLPEDCLDDKATKNGEQILSEQETSAIIDALDALNIDNFENVNIESISLTTINTNADTILASKLIHNKVSDEIASNNDLVVPTSVVENNRITKVQIKNLLQILTDLGVTDINNVNASSLVNSFTKELATKAFNSTEQAGYSAILHATVSDKLNKSDDVVVAPSLKTNTECFKKDPVDMITGSELVSLMSVVKTLDISDIENISFDSLKIDVIDTNKDAISESKILLATITKALEDANLTDIPVSSYDTTIEKDKKENISYYITVAEFKGLISSLKALEIDDFKAAKELDVATLNVSKIAEARTTLSTSAIIKKLVTVETVNALEKQDTGKDPFKIPDEVYDTEKLFTKVEFENLLNGISKLGITNLNTIDVDSLTVETLNTNLSDLLASKILHANITYTIKTLDNDNIIVPDTIYEDEGKVYITETELSSVLDSLQNVFLVNQLTSTEFDTKLNNLSVSTLSANMDKLLESQIMHYTISDKVLAQEATIVIPNKVKEAEGLLISKAELKSLMNGLSALGVTSVESNEFDKINSLSIKTLQEKASEKDETTKLDVLLNSAIMHYTISKQVLDQETKETIVVPDDVKVEEKEAISTTEIKNLINSLEVTGVDSITSIDAKALVDSTLGEKALDDVGLNTLFNSRIIEKTASKHIKDSFADSKSETIFRLPNNVKVTINEETVTVDYVANDVDKEEMINLIKSCRTLGFTSMEVTSFTLADFLNKATEEEVQTVLKSKINSYNLGKQIEDNNKEGGIFNQFLKLPTDMNCFYLLKDGVEGDVYPFMISMTNIYQNEKLHKVLDVLTSAAGASEDILGEDDSVYEKLADNMTNGRILVGTIPSLADKFVDAYKGDTSLINTEDLHKAIPQDKDAKYWRGERVTDGELYRFLIAMNRVSKYNDLKNKPTELQKALEEIQASEIVKGVFKAPTLG